jgi:ubiquinone/menaquinone biosynthesis C-methylase UbiE
MFAQFAAQLQRVGKSDMTILDLGSGPGFLAEVLLEAMPTLELTLLDFSSAMHELARVRLGDKASQVRFLTLSFKSPDWPAGLGTFDGVVTNQAVHELRHKRYAGALHSQVAGLLNPGGCYLARISHS